MTPLQEWLLGQLKRTNETYREASLAAGMDHAAISRFLGGTVPSHENCRKLAEHFGTSVNYVLALAGLIEPPPQTTVFLGQIATATAGWSEIDKARLVEFVRHWPREQP